MKTRKIVQPLYIATTKNMPIFRNIFTQHGVPKLPGVPTLPPFYPIGFRASQI